MRRAAKAGAIAILFTLVATSGCSQEDPEPARTDIVDDLGVLRENFDFTDEQIRCVADFVVDSLPRDELAAFVEEIGAFGVSGDLDDLSPANRTAFTAAVTACAVDLS